MSRPTRQTALRRVAMVLLLGLQLVLQSALALAVDPGIGCSRGADATAVCCADESDRPCCCGVEAPDGCAAENGARVRSHGVPATPATPERIAWAPGGAHGGAGAGAATAPRPCECAPSPATPPSAPSSADEGLQRAGAMGAERSLRIALPGEVDPAGKRPAEPSGVGDFGPRRPHRILHGVWRN